MILGKNQTLVSYSFYASLSKSPSSCRINLMFCLNERLTQQGEKVGSGRELQRSVELKVFKCLGYLFPK